MNLGTIIQNIFFIQKSENKDLTVSACNMIISVSISVHILIGI